MVDKVLKQDSSKCIIPSSEPFRIDENDSLLGYSADSFLGCRAV
jgi:hypothetical protein